MSDEQNPKPKRTRGKPMELRRPPGRPRKYTHVPWLMAEVAYVNSDLSYAELAKKLKCSAAVVERYGGKHKWAHKRKATKARMLAYHQKLIEEGHKDEIRISIELAVGVQREVVKTVEQALTILRLKQNAYLQGYNDATDKAAYLRQNRAPLTPQNVRALTNALRDLQAWANLNEGKPTDITLTEAVTLDLEDLLLGTMEERVVEVIGEGGDDAK